MVSRIKNECLSRSNEGGSSSSKNNRGGTNYSEYLLKYNPNKFDSNVKTMQNKLEQIGLTPLFWTISN